MNERNGFGGSAGWVERFGTTAVFAWWVLTIGGILLSPLFSSIVEEVQLMNKAKLQRQEVAINRKSVRSAMKVYSNLEKLGQHPLARLTIVKNRRKKAAYSETAGGYGLSLQNLLFEALKSLKPSEREPEIPGDEWHPYMVLKETYINGRNIDFIIDQLGILKRTYHRRLNDGLQMLSDKLYGWEEEARAVQSVRYQLAAIPDKPQSHEIVGRDELISSIKTQLLKGGNNVSIALQGLNAGDHLIVSGYQKVINGSPVNVTE